MKKLNSYISKLNIILLVTNITIFCAIYLSHSGFHAEKNLNYQTNTHEFIKKELGFSEAQYQEYLTLNEKVMKGYRRNEELTCINHYDFLLELSKPEPSLAILDSISRANGRLHTGLKVFTARHFLNIKSICTPQQEIELQQLIKEMLQIGSCKDCSDPDCQHRADNENVK